MKKFVHIIEIFVVLVIVFSAIFGFSFFVKQFIHSGKVFCVSFNDIDGLEQGAPVHFMGYYVGSVEKFEYSNQKVNVYFNINDPNLDIPYGSTITIQFTGLVGSKTLEIEPPDYNIYTSNKFIVVDPIRITFFIEFLSKNAKSFEVASDNISKLFGDYEIYETKINISKIKNKIYSISNNLIKAKNIVKDANNTLLTVLVVVNKAFSNSINTTDSIIKSMNTNDYDENTKSVLRIAKFTLIYFYNDLKESNYKRVFEDFTYACNSINNRIGKNSKYLYKKLDFKRYYGSIDSTNSYLVRKNNILTRINTYLNKFDVIKFINNLTENTVNLNRMTKKLQKEI